MDQLTNLPAFGALIFVLLCLWPVARIFRRNGQSPWLCLLMLPSVSVPLTGFILVGAAFVLKKKAPENA